MGLCFIGKYRAIAIGSAFAITLAGVTAYAMRPAKPKKITVVASYLGQSELEDTLEMEGAIGEGQVAPFLRNSGYEVNHVIRFHDLAASSYSMGDGPLKSYFNEHEPETKEARVLFVTVVAMVGEEGVATGLALLDAKVTELSPARVGGPPNSTIEWSYAGPESSMPPQQAAANLEAQLDRGLKAYDRHLRQGSAR